MQEKRLFEIGSKVATAAAVTWTALGLDSLIRPVPDNRRDAAWIVPFLLTVACFWFIHAVQKSSAGRFERTAYWSVMASSGLVLVGINGIIFQVPALEVLGFPGGAMLWTVGLIVFGIAMIRARVLPVFAGLALILLEPGSILTGIALSPIAPLSPRGGYSAGIEKGAVLALIAYAFSSIQKVRPAEASRSESPA